ncbi:MAG TPA: hypothetical protein VGC23_04375 [Vicinamibacterales bacterium]
MIRVRLIRKFATSLNGVDLSQLKVGDITELPDAAARMMIAERWAEQVVEHIRSTPPTLPRTSPSN